MYVCMYVCMCVSVCVYMCVCCECVWVCGVSTCVCECVYHQLSCNFVCTKNWCLQSGVSVTLTLVYWCVYIGVLVYTGTHMYTLVYWCVYNGSTIIIDYLVLTCSDCDTWRVERLRWQAVKCHNTGLINLKPVTVVLTNHSCQLVVVNCVVLIVMGHWTLFLTHRDMMVMWLT